MHYPLVAPITPQQLFNGLKLRQRHLNYSVEFLLSGTIIISQILDEEFQGIEMGHVTQHEFIEVSRINRVSHPDL